MIPILAIYALVFIQLCLAGGVLILDAKKIRILADTLSEIKRQGKRNAEKTDEAVDTAKTAAKVADTSAKAVLGVRDFPEARRDVE